MLVQQPYGHQRYHWCMLVSCEAPWDGDERLLEQTFRAEVRRTLANGFTDLYIFGTAGEGYAVDTATFQKIASVFREETEEARSQVGVIGLSTAQVRERLRIAYGLGFRMFQISLPCWGTVNDTEMMKFFSDVCSAFPDCGFLHYNLLRSKRLVTAAEYRRMADRLPKLVATKNTGTTIASTAELLRLTPDLQHFLAETLYLTGTLYGPCSLLSSFAPMIPLRSRELFELGVSGDTRRLFRFQVEYLKAVEEIIAPLRRQPLMGGAYDKVLVRLGGDMPLRLLSPYQGFDESIFEERRAILQERYADWVR